MQKDDNPSVTVVNKGIGCGTLVMALILFVLFLFAIGPCASCAFVL